jgi:adenosylcobinamide-GDP ribazoletransferase
VTGLLLAARYLTIVPAGRGPVEADGEGLGRAVAWFPVVGLAIGAVLVGVAALAGRLFPGLLAALLAVTAWKLLTGGLHLDGLADCLDGLHGHDPAHRLRIMSDSRIGAFGAMGLILFLLLEIAAVAELPEPTRWGALLAAPAIGRATPAVLALLFSAARPEGQGARFAARVQPVSAAAGLLIAGAASVLVLGNPGVAAAGAGMAAALAAGAFLASRLGGITGDVLGAGVEVGELTALLVVLAWARP